MKYINGIKRLRKHTINNNNKKIRCLDICMNTCDVVILVVHCSNSKRL